MIVTKVLAMNLMWSHQLDRLKVLLFFSIICILQCDLFSQRPIIDAIELIVEDNKFNQVFDIECDPDGYVYLATELGLYIYDGDKIQSIEYYTQGQVVTPFSITNLTKIDHKIFGLSNSGMIIRIDLQTKQISQYNVRSKVNQLYYGYKNAKNEIIFVGITFDFNKLIELKLNDDDVTFTYTDKTSFDAYHNEFISKYVDAIHKPNRIFSTTEFRPNKNGFLYLKNQVYKKNGNKYEHKLDGTTYGINGIITGIVENKDTSMYISVLGESKGLYLVKHKKIIQIIDRSNITSVIKDCYTNIWYSTYDGKILLINTHKAKIHRTVLSKKFETIKKISKDTYLGAEAHGRLYMSKDLKIWKKLLNSNYNIRSYLGKANESKFYYYYQSGGAIIDTTLAMVTFKIHQKHKYHNFSQMKLWKGYKFYFSKNYLYYNKINDDIIDLVHLNKQQLEGEIYQIEVYQDDLWVITTKGLIKFDLEIRNNQIAYRTTTELKDSTIHQFVINENKAVALGNKHLHIKNDAQWRSEDIPKDMISKFDLAKLLVIKSSIGLYKNQTLFVKDIDKNHYNTFNITKEGILQIDQKDDSIFILTTEKQLHSFSIQDIFSTNNKSANVVLSSIKYAGNNLPLNTVPNIKYIAHSHLQLRFDVFDYSLNEKKYHYKIYKNGTSSSFTPVTEKILNLYNLQPGKYKIQFFDNQYKNLNADFSFEITPSWFQNVLFQSIIFSLFSIMIYFALNFINKKRIENNLKDLSSELNLLKLETSNKLNQIKPHFIFNAIEPIRNHIYNQRTDDALTAIDNFTILLRRMFVLSRVIHINIADEIFFLESFVKYHQENSQKNFSFTLHNHLDQNDLKYFLYSLILQPIIENAIKYGIEHNKDGTIELTIENTDQYFTFTIADSGPGFNFPTDIKKKHSLGVLMERIILYRRMDGISSILFEKTESKFQVIINLPKIKKNDKNKLHHNR